MKILYIVPKINNEGGVARILSIKANYLVEKLDYQIHILTQNNGNKPLFYEFNTKITLHDMILEGNKFSFFFQYKKALNKTIKTIKTINPDIIIVCDNGLKAYSIPFILKTKKPIIFECHGAKFVEEKYKGTNFISNLFSKIKSNFKNFGASKFTKFVALSNESLNEWNLKNGIIIPNPLWFETTQYADLKSKKVIMIARHSYEKGIDRMLPIWKSVSEKHPDWELEIYGEIDKKLGLQNVAKSLKINKNVTFFNPVKNVQDNYFESSILAMTSRTEGFGMVLIEAMACGLPVIAYDCQVGPRAIIQNNENGLLIEDGNTNLFVEKLNLLIENETLRIELGKNAKKSIEKYNIDTIMNQWKNLFENLVNP